MGVHTRDDGSRVRIAHVADDEIVLWHERRVRFESFGRIEREAETLAHGVVRAEHDRSTSRLWKCRVRGGVGCPGQSGRRAGCAGARAIL